MANGHEGKRLRELLKKHGIGAAAFAKAAGCTASSMSRTFGYHRFSSQTWQTVARGLIAHGIQPSEIRQNDDAVMGMGIAPQRELLQRLKAIVTGLKADEVATIKEALSLPPVTRDLIIEHIETFIDGLQHGKQR